jgi:hypothetical protein
LVPQLLDRLANASGEFDPSNPSNRALNARRRVTGPSIGKRGLKKPDPSTEPSPRLKQTKCRPNKTRSNGNSPSQQPTLTRATHG